MIKITCFFVALCTCFCSKAFSCNGEDGVFTKEAKPAYTALFEKDWKKSSQLIKGLEESPLKNYWLGAWYYAKGNDMYNPQTAVEHWENASKQGCFEAKLTLAGAYFIARDPRIVNIGKSLDLFKDLLPDLEKKSETDSVTALCNLGFIHMFGIVVKKDLKKSFSFYERASKLNQMESDCKANHATLQKLKEIDQL